MSDAQLRRLERAARAGDHQAAEQDQAGGGIGARPRQRSRPPLWGLDCSTDENGAETMTSETYLLTDTQLRRLAALEHKASQSGTAHMSARARQDMSALQALQRRADRVEGAARNLIACPPGGWGETQQAWRDWEAVAPAGADPLEVVRVAVAAGRIDAPARMGEWEEVARGCP